MDHTQTSRAPCIVALVLALSTAIPAGAAPEPMLWYVAPQDDAEAWQRAAEQTWADGALRAHVFDGEWPPPADGTAHAYFEGALPEGIVVIRTPDAADRHIPVWLEAVTPDEARKAMLLLVGSIVHPLGIADGGWVPETEGEVADGATAPPAEGPDLPDMASAPPPRSDRLHVALALGGSGRPGLDRPSFAPSARLGVTLGKSRSPRVSLVLDLSADLFGMTWADAVPLQLDAIGVVGGLEVRLGTAKLGFPLWGGAGIRALTASRGDQQEGGYPAAVAPFLRFGGGVSVEVADGVRIGARAAMGIELLRGDPPIQLQVGEAWEASSRDLLPLSIGGQVEVEIDARRGSTGP
jgi:hypothetical protein